mgnify:CR=1 FL=1
MATRRLATHSSVGARTLVDALRKRGWTKHRLTKELDLPEGLASRWAAGKAVPGLTYALLLEEVLDIPIAAWADTRRMRAVRRRRARLAKAMGKKE